MRAMEDDDGRPLLCVLCERAIDDNTLAQRLTANELELRIPRHLIFRVCGAPECESKVAPAPAE
jgi:hypothetical protein